MFILITKRIFFESFFFQVLLAKLTGDPEYVNAATNFCNYVRNSATRTPKGLIWLTEWGSLRAIATVAFACLQAADAGINTVENRLMAKEQMGYILGDAGRSFVVGYGYNPPQRPHHRARFVYLLISHQQNVTIEALTSFSVLARIFQHLAVMQSK